ncbi:sensor histidine kinase [Chryseosolibacter indicus]|uniref:Histidine kinase n=1 Tax=Chryseosolibacter indicus TaxID=2782351 RepID=A0ABS5VMV3_9BACT|nr:histidine kinase [Chryseosolibacter indicus]MBT1702763.1 histidine kinase [Chryseosolibacter indicus]
MIKNLSYRTTVIANVSWIAGWTVIQALILYIVVGLNLYLSVTDALVNNILLAMAGYAMFQGLKYYHPGLTYQLIAATVLTAFAVLLFQLATTQIFPDNEDYLNFVNNWIIIRGIINWLMLAVVTVLSWLWFNIKEQKESELRKLTTEKLAREAELASLRQKLQPHFLFNSLNSINALIGSRPEEARKMVQQLSDFFRSTLKKDDQQLVPFSEELQHLELYLDIEKVRFGHRLKTHIEHDDDALGLVLPALLLQPVVENAIKFGLYDTTGEIIIRIKARTENNFLVVTVENPYDPETSKPKQGTGFGLNAIQRRLYLLYARQDLLTTMQDEVTFSTQIRIPQ